MGYDLDGCAAELESLAGAHGIVGVAVGVSIGGVRSAWTAGLADPSSAAPVERSTTFLVGSVTKAMTASMVALLVGEHRVDLDTPVRSYVPEFEVADARASAEITVRHLLTHTAGFDGDVWPDHGEGDDAIARFVSSMQDLPQVAPPGRRFSYNNAGYSVLGRLVECIEGESFERVLQRRIARACGAGLTTDGRRVDAQARAIGHVGSTPVEQAVGPACLAPAGSRTWASIDDLLAFGEWHLGRTDPAAHEALLAMRAPQRHVADPNNAGTMALGVFIDEQRWGTPVVFHDGGVAGHAAYLRIVPEDDAVIAVMCTGGVPQTFHRHVLRAVADHALGRSAPLGVLPDPTVRLDPVRYVGRFRSVSTDIEIADVDGELHAVITWGEGTDQVTRTAPLPLSAVDPMVLLAPLDGRDYVLVYPPLDEPSHHLLAGLRLLVRQ